MIAVTLAWEPAAAVDSRGLNRLWELPGSTVMPGEPVVALTFDDGPHPTYTRQVALILERYGVRGTFFQVGREIARFPGITADLAAAGHAVENHTWDHADLTKMSAGSFAHQVDDTTAWIESTTGQRVECVRPPYGAANGTVLNRLASRGLVSVVWSIDTGDFNRPGANAITRRVLDNLHPGAIVLMHDGGGDRSQTVAALPAIIEGIQARGYRIVPACHSVSRRRPGHTEASWDRDADRVTDFVLTRSTSPETTTWYWANGHGFEAVPWGHPGLDVPTPGDFDGDGHTDVAVWRPSSPAQFWIQGTAGANHVVAWGEGGSDIPLGIGDWDGDGTDDLSVVRYPPGAGPLTWFVALSGGGSIVTSFGERGDAPAPADYDGDGRMDLAVYRNLGTHMQLYGSTSSAGPFELAWGQYGDFPVTGEFDGDARADAALVRLDGSTGNLVWFVHGSAGADIVVQWGRDGDHPVAKDYDRDRRTDIAVWRPEHPGSYWIRRSTDGGLSHYAFGAPGDRPPVVVQPYFSR